MSTGVLKLRELLELAGRECVTISSSQPVRVRPTNNPNAKNLMRIRLPMNEAELKRAIQG
jgi:hypothetical protein